MAGGTGAAAGLLKLTQWSERDIARRLAVSNSTVNSWAPPVRNRTDAEDTPRTVTVTRNGTSYEMQEIVRGRAVDDF